jgi:hypothetical protein
MIKELSIVEYIEELSTKSAPRIKKAAAKISKQRLDGYEASLLDALKSIIDKPRSWQAQSEVIRALGIANCIAASAYLRDLAQLQFDSTVLYRDLGFAICLLEDIPNNRLDFLKETLSSGNELLIAGACSALLFSRYIPSDSDIDTIIESISKIDTNEGQVITPRCYIAALAYLWPKNKTKGFLEYCMQSNWQGLVEIAQCSIEGKKTKYVLV